MISGLDFISKAESENADLNATSPRAYALTLPLITTSKGSKLGKSAGNATWLWGPHCSAYDILQVFFEANMQFFIRCPDSLLSTWIRQFTLLSCAEIKHILARHNVKCSR